MASNLNPDQQNADKEFLTFLLSDEKEMKITGPGGSGKTYLMGQLIDNTIPRYENLCKLTDTDPLYTEVEMRATTNKAAESLGQATKRPTGTIQSFLNLRVQDDYTTGKSKMSRTRNWTVHNKKIIFIDEYTMIGTDLAKFIDEGTSNCKIVYVGDHCQLNPVMESSSPIDRKNIRTASLTIPERNKNSPALINLCNQLRETVETGIFKPIEIIPGSINKVVDSEMDALLDQHYNDPNTEGRFLAFSNQRVTDLNDYIRDIRKLPTDYQVGETLINSSGLQLKDRILSVEEEVTITKIDNNIESIEIDPDNNITLEIRHINVLTKYNELITDLCLPVDMEYYYNLIKYYQREQKWIKYFYLKNNFPDFRSKDSSTLHKAQGSTFDWVFIDLDDISKCRNPDQIARLLYVAISRAKNEIFFYGSLPDKYGKLII